jgi:hypothetical protein
MYLLQPYKEDSIQPPMPPVEVKGAPEYDFGGIDI